MSSISSGNPRLWLAQLTHFVRENQQQLAALDWALFLDQGKDKLVIGVDFQPQPHLILCRQGAIETLNQQVDNSLQEVVGIVQGQKAEQEVFILGLGPGSDCQFQLIQIQPDPAPPVCYEQFAEEIPMLIEGLENHLALAIEQVNADQRLAQSVAAPRSVPYPQDDEEEWLE